MIRSFLVLALAACLPLAGQLHAQPAPAVSPEPFFKNPEYRSLKLSPSGKHVGVLVPIAGRMALAVITLQPRSIKVVGGIEGQDINWFEWVNDERVVFGLIDLQSGLGEQRATALYAVDRDGSDFRVLVPRPAMSFRARYLALLRLMRNGSDDVLIVTNDLNERYPDVYRLDTRTGRRTLMSFDRPGNVVRWVADRQGVIRACVTWDRDTGDSRVYWRASGDAKWEQIAAYGLRGPSMTPVTFDGDGSLIVAADKDRDTAALYRYDTTRRALGELLAAHPTHDLRGGLVYDEEKKRIVGLTYDAERPGNAWFDEEWATISQGIDKALPDHMNVLSRAGGRILVDSYSDVDPGSYYLFDIAARKLELLVPARGGIKPESMPHREAVRYTARDGLSIPAYLTLPANTAAKDLPLVVEVHGGPWVRGSHWRWDGQAAYLASLGYAVLQPEFRGSTGWGRKAFEASWKQWGRAMQDDLNDGVDWLVKRGIADRSRVCIMGASYGGYAVMEGLARDPDLWKCGVNWVGVTDITYMFDITWSDMWNSDWMKSSAKEMIGDPDKDAALLKAVSPLQNASRVKAPVLMVYGGGDRRVPVVHGEQMRDALQKQGVPVEWVVYQDEAHGFLFEPTRIDFYTRVAKFLDAQIGTAATTRTSAGK
jgi:dipeptidyl aminopeptidase/acylaminoacyl peptidase